MDRTISVTEHVGRHVLGLRTSRKWSRERLARALDAVGCPIAPNSIWKMEQVPPERRIDADEIVALAIVFDTTPHQLLGWAAHAAAEGESVSDGACPPTTQAPVTAAEITQAWSEYARLGRELDDATEALSQAGEGSGTAAIAVVRLHGARESVRRCLDDMAARAIAAVPRG